MKRTFKQINRVMAGALSALVLLTGCGKGKGSDDQPDEVYEVTRGEFNIVISANGTLDAIKRYRIESPPVARLGLDIIEAVPDQTPLKKDDLIIAFSDEKYQDQLEEQKIKIEEGEKNLMLLQQDFQMEIADRVSLIKKSSDAHRVSIEVLEKYVKEDAPLQKKNLQMALESARKDVEDETKNLASLKEDLLSASMGDEAARLKIEQQVTNSEEAIRDLESKEEKAAYNLRMFKQYTYPQRSREVEREVVKAEMDLQKQLVNAAAKRVQLERKMDAQQRTLRTQRRQHDELLDNISMLRITAPVDGVISYGNPDPRRRGREQKDITVGTSMRPSEIIGSIPDLSKLVVNLDVPESTRPKIDVGMRAEMRIKALPNLRLSGEVSKISDMASHLTFWDRTSPKIYPTVVALDQGDPRLRPGMTVEVDMVSEEVQGVIFVPVEALFAKEGSIYCRVKKVGSPDVRKVTIGRSSSSFVEILDGVKPGEKVLLSREEL